MLLQPPVNQEAPAAIRGNDLGVSNPYAQDSSDEDDEDREFTDTRIFSI